MSTSRSSPDGWLLGEIEEGMPVYDVHHEPVGTVRRVAPGRPDSEDIVIADGNPGPEYAARADQLGAVDREEGVMLTAPRDDLRQA